jgi:Cd2+/Zn2+-exporting ATPase
VKELDHVKDAKVNFSASKITIYGSVSLKELEKAGKFENLSFHTENEEMTRIPLWRGKAALRTTLSGILILIGWALHFIYGEGSLASLTAYAASIIIGGYFLFIQGMKNLFRLRFDMKTLMTIAILGAAAIGEWGEGAAVVFLFAISEVLETYSMDKARQSIRSLMNLAPKEATIRRDQQELKLLVDEIRIGDIMIVKPGEKLAMDGKVLKGVSTINQATITGESISVVKNVDDEVFAGTLNEEGLLEVLVTKRVEDTTIAKIIHLVEEAQAEKAPAQAFVDRFAMYYTPVIILIALGIVTIPPLLFDGVWADWIYRGLTVLVVGCPCALVISTPVAIVTAIGNAARHGVLIKGGIYLEEVSAISAIAFDKTGTLTKGIPHVTDFIPMDQTLKEKDLLGIAAVIEKGSHHPLAASILRKAEQEKVNLSAWRMDDFASLTGKGIKATINDEIYYIGSPKLIKEVLPSTMTKPLSDQIHSLQNEGKTVMILANEKCILALLAVADQVRKESKNVIDKIHQLGIQKTIMLTGDNQRTGNAIGQQLGMSEIKAELLPQDKLDVVKQLKHQYKKVAMVGDGVNDAPALASATVGIAMGGAGTDTALETADIALMADDLSKLPFTIELSRKAMNIIKENIVFSIGIKVIALLLIMPGWLTLWMAIFADMGATLIVTLNGLRLLRVKPKKE